MAPKGTDDFRRLRDYDMTWRDDARRFEFITLPFQEFAGMNASLELFFEVGVENIARHIESLASEIVHWAETQNAVKLITPRNPSGRAGIVCVRPRDAQRASDRLKAKGIVHSFREGNIRLAPHMYNTVEEVRTTLELMSS
jgi:selenocysteine lyase/cysteine desulfurase